MPGVISSARKVLHDTSSALIDKQIPKKLSDAVTGVVSAGFDIVDDVLTIVRDLTKQSEGGS